jgi:hypothetical protein
MRPPTPKRVTPFPSSKLAPAFTGDHGENRSAMRPDWKVLERNVVSIDSQIDDFSSVHVKSGLPPIDVFANFLLAGH